MHRHGAHGRHRAALAGGPDADLDGYQRRLDEAQAICARHPHQQAVGFAELLRVMLDEWRGDYAGAIEHAERTIAIGRTLRLQADGLARALDKGTMPPERLAACFKLAPEAL